VIGISRSITRIVALGALALVFAGLATSAPMADGPASNADELIDGRPWVELIKIDGSINPAVAHFIEDSVASAQMGGGRALIIELDTPGGLMSSAERIVKDLFAAPLPVIVYVAPTGASAASAGTFITIAASLAAMAPGTNIGAAHPVTESGGDVKGDLGTKVENFAAMLARNTARQRGRNEDWAEKAVRDSVMIGDREALESKVVEIVATSIPDLLKQADGRAVEVGDHKVTLQLKDAVVRQRSMTLGQSVLDTLADPNIVYLLLMAGLLGLYFEFAHPGVYLPGVAGSICLLLALASFQVLPVTLTGLLLMLLGVGMLISETFVASYGVMGIGGVIALLIGSLLLIDTSKTNLAVQHSIIYGAAGSLSAIILLIGYFVAREHGRVATTGKEGLVGELAEVREPIAPDSPGKVFVHGEIWRARSDDALSPGAQARVTSVNGLEVRVQRIA
jgi:membrane-bound serine protease (ClpP class)